LAVNHDCEVASMDTDLLTSDELCTLTGCPTGSLKFMRASGVVRPARRGDRVRGIPVRGSPDRWTLAQALALATARGLRFRGMDAEQSESVLAYLGHMTPAQLDEHFRRGQTHLGIVGGRCVMRLTSFESIFLNESIDYVAAAAVGVCPAAVNCELIWRRLREELVKIRRKEAGVPATAATGHE
jgi:hypothetical protein